MPRGMTDRQIARMKGRWFKDYVKIYRIKGITSDRENRTLIDTSNCLYVGESGSTLGAQGQTQQFSSTVYIASQTLANDRNASYRLIVSVSKSRNRRTDPDGPAEQDREVKLQAIQIDEKRDPDGNLICMVVRCQNAKD